MSRNGLRSSGIALVAASRGGGATAALAAGAATPPLLESRPGAQRDRAASIVGPRERDARAAAIHALDGITHGVQSPGISTTPRSDAAGKFSPQRHGLGGRTIAEPRLTRLLVPTAFVDVPRFKRVVRPAQGRASRELIALEVAGLLQTQFLTESSGTTPRSESRQRVRRMARNRFAGAIAMTRRPSGWLVIQEEEWAGIACRLRMPGAGGRSAGASRIRTCIAGN